MANRSEDWLRQAFADLEHNGFAMGAPMDYFVERDALEAIAYAQSILEFCRSQVRGQK